MGKRDSMPDVKDFLEHRNKDSVFFKKYESLLRTSSLWHRPRLTRARMLKGQDRTEIAEKIWPSHFCIAKLEPVQPAKIIKVLKHQQQPQGHTAKSPLSLYRLSSRFCSTGETVSTLPNYKLKKEPSGNKSTTLTFLTFLSKMRLYLYFLKMLCSSYRAHIKITF